MNSFRPKVADRAASLDFARDEEESEPASPGFARDEGEREPASPDFARGVGPAGRPTPHHNPSEVEGCGTREARVRDRCVQPGRDAAEHPGAPMPPTPMILHGRADAPRG